MVVVLTLIAFATFKGVLTAPIDKDYISWQNEPNVRGTWSILSSCIVTLILCVYSAVHSDVPHPNDSTLRRRLRIAKWVVAGIFAPEMVVWVAWEEWRCAKRLSIKLEALLAEEPPKDELEPFDPVVHQRYRSVHDLLDTWTLQHSFLVGMGGYQFPPSKAVQNWDHPGRPRCMINGPLLLKFIEDGHVSKLPVLTSKDIADRSKADYLAKALSCIQGLWLAFQLLGRVIGNLIITELEVNTFAHVLCAVAMYSFWMNKPFNIQQPAWINIDGLENWLEIQTGLRKDTWKLLRANRDRILVDATSDSDSLPPHIHYPSEYVEGFMCQECELQNPNFNRRLLGFVYSGSDIDLDPNQVIKMLSQDQLGYPVDFVMRGDFPKKKLWAKNRKWYRSHEAAIIRVKSEDELETILRIWKLSNMEELKSLSSQIRLLDFSPHMLDKSHYSGTLSILIMLAVSSCYGALHASLWWHHFPSVAEQYLWRISSIAVVGNSIMFIVFMGALEITDSDTPQPVLRFCRGYDPGNLVRKPLKWSESFLDWIETNMDWFNYVILFFLVVSIGSVLLAFAFGRVFLFAEAFVSLRSQPASAYITPQWSQWFPHL